MVNNQGGTELPVVAELAVRPFCTSEVPTPSSRDPRVNCWRDVDGATSAYSHTVEGRHWIHFVGVGSFVFEGSENNVRVQAYPRAPLRVVMDKYQRAVVPIILQVLGYEVLHASAVMAQQRACLFCGHSGGGKSTIAHALSRRGFRKLADDVVILAPTQRGICAVPMPFEMRLRDGAARFFGEPGCGDEMPVGEDDADSISGYGLAIGAVFVLRRRPFREEGEGFCLRQYSGKSGLTAILAHANCFGFENSVRNRQTMLNYLELAATKPVYELSYASNWNTFSGLIDAVEGFLV